jgi:putative sigma-54 modulation protein
MDMLEKNLGSIKVLNCDVEVGMTSNHHNKGEIYRTEVNLNLPGELLRVEKTEEDLYRSIDNVKDHLTMAIKKYKEKRVDRNRQMNEIEIEEILDIE